MPWRKSVHQENTNEVETELFCMGEIDGRDSYCRAEHLTGLLGGADLFIYLFPFSLSRLNSAICVPLFFISIFLSPQYFRKFTCEFLTV